MQKIATMKVTSQLKAIARRTMLKSEQQANYYGTEELINRGWTRSLRRSLGIADAWTEATKLDIAHPLWFRSRVEAIEATEEWRTYRDETDRRIREVHGKDLAAVRAERRSRNAELLRASVTPLVHIYQDVRTEYGDDTAILYAGISYTGMPLDDMYPEHDEELMSTVDLDPDDEHGLDDDDVRTGIDTEVAATEEAHRDLLNQVDELLTKKDYREYEYVDHVPGFEASGKRYLQPTR
jgi:hypothetical protein